MADGTKRRFPVSRHVLARGAGALLTALVVATLCVAIVSDAFAQERKRRWFSLRELFAPRSEERAPRVLSDPSELPRVKAYRQKQAAARKKQRSVAREPEVVVQEKAADAKIILVIGDFIGSGLAEGLSLAYADNPGVTVIDRTRGSSGFVREDVYNWPVEIKALVEKEKPAVVLVMLGSNDRQQMRVGETREATRSANWTKEYERRATTLAEALSDLKTPYVWLGLPSFKSSKLSDDVLAFNETYRAAASSTGGQFIDVWDGFVDENGAFMTTGPDVSGQPVRLRTGDGVNFTRAGKRKLAFYAEKPLAKLLGLSPSGAPAPVAALPDMKTDPRAPLPVDRTVPMSLDDPELDGGTELMGASSAAGADRATPVPVATGTVVGKQVPGRADDFGGPTTVAAPATREPLEDQATAAR